MIFVAIILDKHNEVKTNYLDFSHELKHHKDGIRCCFDVDLIVHEYSRTSIGDFKLIPLDEFKCKRTIVGIGGTRISVETSFGLTRDDFIEMNFQEVDLQEKNKFSCTGLLISKNNPYYLIVNALAKHFDFVDADNDNSFVLDGDELSTINLVPFNLKYDFNFVVSDIEKEMHTDEYDGIVEQLYCSDFSL